MKNYLVKMFIGFLVLTFQTAFAQQKINLNGYLQYRFSDNYLNQTNFSVRRAKFWVNGSLPYNEGNWGYIFHFFINRINFISFSNYTR